MIPLLKEIILNVAQMKNSNSIGLIFLFVGLWAFELGRYEVAMGLFGMSLFVFVFVVIFSHRKAKKKK